MESLDCNSNSIADLTPLRGKPLKVLNTGSNRIADLHPPAGLPLTEPMIRNNPIADYAMLLELRQLQKLLISELSQIKVSLEPLRQQPSLQYIAFDSNGRYRPVAEFWADYARSKSNPTLQRAMPRDGSLRPNPESARRPGLTVSHAGVVQAKSVAVLAVPSSAARSAGERRPPGRVPRMECLRPAEETCPEVTFHRRSAPP